MYLFLLAVTVINLPLDIHKVITSISVIIIPLGAFQKKKKNYKRTSRRLRNDHVSKNSDIINEPQDDYGTITYE
jgi:hypothetical protein